MKYIGTMFWLILTTTVSVNTSGSELSSTRKNGAPAIIDREVRLVDGDNFDFKECEFATQQICSSQRGLHACVSWHKRLAAKNHADTINIINQDKSFSLWSFTGTSISVVADYYNCRHRN